MDNILQYITNVLRRWKKVLLPLRRILVGYDELLLFPVKTNLIPCLVCF